MRTDLLLKDKEKPCVVFFYSYLAGYFMNCVNSFVELSNFQAYIFSYGTDNDAPYIIENSESITYIDVNTYTNNEIQTFLTCNNNIRCIFIVNWGIIRYLRIVFNLKMQFSDIPVIVGMDKPWTGSFKQRVGQMTGLFGLSFLFDYVWLPSYGQYDAARKFGFKSNKILIGLYAADITKFQDSFRKRQKLIKYPHVILYMGRLLDWKGIETLYNAFNELKSENQNDWQLYIVGNGSLKTQLKETDDIKIFDFIQPNDIPSFIENIGAFCLPSWFEHWGVVVQEFSAAGLPLILSDGVTSKSDFLINGYNGFLFQSKNTASLKEKLSILFNKSDLELEKMGNNSFLLSSKNTPEIWSYRLLNIIINQ